VCRDPKRSTNSRRTFADLLARIKTVNNERYRGWSVENRACCTSVFDRPEVIFDDFRLSPTIPIGLLFENNYIIISRHETIHTTVPVRYFRITTRYVRNERIAKRVYDVVHVVPVVLYVLSLSVNENRRTMLRTVRKVQ